jgi:succinoglycan biosynthesis protein ExoA
MLISLVTPCRNEAAHIGAFLDSALAQRLAAGDTLELIVADGASDDGTRALLDARAAAEPRLRVIDNPARITPTALNRAIAAAHGDVVVRLDVHTQYAPDYVAQCVRVLGHTGATCVGGAWQPVGQGAIAQAFRSRFGSGGAASRREGYSGPVDTVYLGAWRKTELVRLGGFDESLVRNQDDELNLRIVRGGGRVWQDASIRSWYAPRESFGALARQFYQYGYWKVPVIRKHRLPASPRHLVPFGFVLALGILAVLGLGWRPAWAGLAVLAGVYGAAALGNAALISPPRAPAIAWAFACMHIGYGAGFGRGLIDFVLLRRVPGAAATRLTR